ncbi:MAG: hypothetical protein A2140_08615, partial [Candidatus Muproteobacteria bacterium RBG_16_62_13]
IGIIAAIAIPQYQEYVVRARISEGFALSSSVQRAIEAAHARGLRPGQLPANPAELGLNAPETYSGIYVQSVSHNTQGQVTIVLSRHPSLGKQAGGTVVLAPLVEGDKLHWKASPDGSVPKRYLPLSYR